MYFIRSGRQDLVTFGDPVATSIKTSFEELTPLRPATGGSHLLPRSAGLQIQPYILNHIKKPTFTGKLFYMVDVLTR